MLARRSVVVVAVATVVTLPLVVAGCAAHTTTDLRPAPSRHAMRFTPPAPNPAPNPASGPVSARLVLDATSASVGARSIRGHLDVDNESGASITLNGACNGWVQVGLVNSRVAFRPVSGLLGCAADYLPVGSSRTPIDVATTYSTCLQDPPAANDDTPRCTGGGHTKMPPLPAGRYRTTVAFGDVRPRIPTPLAVTVTLTKP